MKSDALAIGYYEDGLVFDDGSKLGADVIVFATGFEGNMKVMIRDLFSDDVAAQLDDFWGLDEEGEIRGAFRPSGRECILWCAGTHPFQTPAFFCLVFADVYGNRSTTLASWRDVRPSTILLEVSGTADSCRAGWYSSATICARPELQA